MSIFIFKKASYTTIGGEIYVTIKGDNGSPIRTFSLPFTGSPLSAVFSISRLLGEGNTFSSASILGDEVVEVFGRSDISAVYVCGEPSTVSLTSGHVSASVSVPDGIDPLEVMHAIVGRGICTDYSDIFEDAVSPF